MTLANRLRIAANDPAEWAVIRGADALLALTPDSARESATWAAHYANLALDLREAAERLEQVSAEHAALVPFEEQQRRAAFREEPTDGR